MRRLIINADDFGLTPGVNRAIGEAHATGIVTSATLMANGRAFDDAIATAKRLPELSLGCHVVLVDGQPILPAREIPSLLADGTHFPADFAAVAKRAFRNQIRGEEIEAEVTAQTRRLQSAGITVSHLDSHKHVHMLPAVCAALLRAGRACGVRAIRNPFVPARPLAQFIGHPQLWKRYLQTRILRRYERQFLKQVADAGMTTTNGSFGVIGTGSLDAELFRTVIDSVPEGTWEFVCHPGYVDEELAAIRTRLRESREKELAVLTSVAARSALAARHIELISYSTLTANQ